MGFNRNFNSSTMLIIQNPKTLQGMAEAGLIKLNDQIVEHSDVSGIFEYEGHSYRVRYIEGLFQNHVEFIA